MSRLVHNNSHNNSLRRDSQIETSQLLPELVSLDADALGEILPIENQSYPNPWSARLIEGEFGKFVSFRLGLRREGKLVGYAFNHIVEDELHVLNIAVDPNSRGKGLGTYLLATVLAKAFEKGARQVYLEVRPSNSAAINLYSKLGFLRTGLRKNYYRDNGEDALLFELLLTEEEARHFGELSVFPKNR